MITQTLVKMNLTEQKCKYWYSKTIESGTKYTRMNGILENELCGTPRMSLPLMSRDDRPTAVRPTAVRAGERVRDTSGEATKWAQIWVTYPFPYQYLAHNGGLQCLGSSNCM